MVQDANKFELAHIRDLCGEMTGIINAMQDETIEKHNNNFFICRSELINSLKAMRTEVLTGKID